MDLTKGKPWKALMLFSIPILLSTLLGNAFGLINALVLKVTVGGDAVTAINCTGSISALLFNFAYGASGGFSVLASNDFGAKSYEKIRKTFLASLVLSLLIGILLMAGGLLCLPYFLVALNVNAIYIADATAYFQIILISFPFMLLANLLGNFLRALGNSFMPLVYGLITTLLNILFDYLFTGVFRFGVQGVAAGTLIANVADVLLTYAYLYKKYPYLRFSKEGFKGGGRLYWALLAMGIPLGLQWSILFIGSFVLSSQVNLFGNGLATKAGACYSSWESYLTIPLSVMATSLMSFVGQNYGAKKFDRIRQGFRDALLIDFCSYLVVLAIGLSTARAVPYIFLPEEEVNDRVVYYCSTYLFVMTPFLICQGTLQLSRSVLQGIKKPLLPFLSGIGELGARIAVCLWIPGLISPSNPTSDAAYLGLCFSDAAAWVMSVLIMGGSVLYFLFFSKLFRNPDKDDLGKRKA
jgi:putative MATE family efflux protein